MEAITAAEAPAVVREILHVVPRCLIERLGRAGGSTSSGLLARMRACEESGLVPVAFYGRGGMVLLENSPLADLDRAEVTYDPDAGTVETLHVAWRGNEAFEPALA